MCLTNHKFILIMMLVYSLVNIFLYTISGNTTESYKVNDLNVEAEASVDDEDDVDWEEG